MRLMGCSSTGGRAPDGEPPLACAGAVFAVGAASRLPVFVWVRARRVWSSKWVRDVFSSYPLVITLLALTVAGRSYTPKARQGKALPCLAYTPDSPLREQDPRRGLILLARWPAEGHSLNEGHFLSGRYGAVT